MSRGTVTLEEEDREVSIREKLVSALKDKYGMIGPNDLELLRRNCPSCN